MKKRLKAVPLLAAIVLGLAACGTGPTQSDSADGTIPLLKAGMVNSYSTLDPYRTVGCNALYCGLFMEHLLSLGPDGNIEPNLAESWSNPDPTTYVYNIRRGVRFWDGTELTADDVAYSLNHDRAPGSKVEFAFSSVADIVATDRYTVVVTLKQPDAGWKYSLTYEGPIFQRKFHEEHGDTMGDPGVLIQATGAWRVDSFNPTTRMELSANPDWWGGEVPVQRISYTFYSDEQSLALAMRAGDIDVAFPQDGRTFAATSGANVEPWQGLKVGYFGMNTKLAPWNDVHVRRAVAHALNRDEIIAATGGPEISSPAFVQIPEEELRTIASPEQVDAVVQSLPQYPYDLDLARQEMAQSAYPNGFTATMDIYDDGAYADVVQVIAAQLAKIGITLELNNVGTQAQWVTRMTGEKTYGAMFSTLYAASPDPSIHANYLYGSRDGGPTEYNFANYTSPEIEQLIKEGMATSDQAERLAIYGELLTKAATEVPYVPLYKPHDFSVVSDEYTLKKPILWPAFYAWALDIERTD
jgi:peptide/nickel transport system substrate-binding protein